MVRSVHASGKLYLEYIDGYINGYVDKVPKCQTGNECIGPVPHALVLVYNPKQGGVADQAHHKHNNRYYGVDVLEIVLNGCNYTAHWRFYWLPYDRFICRARHYSLCGNTWGPQV